MKSLSIACLSLLTLCSISSTAIAGPSTGGTIPSGPYPNACDGPVLPKKCGGGYGDGGRKHVPQVPSTSSSKTQQVDTRTPPFNPPQPPIVNQPHR